ncbi:hypothetical protein [Micromonospora sp. WMMA1947]|uniref:hypothetical protein n=1 Tax=Micromonospora sp. WMMA1947 TaxID=3015163 RepID=UPI00248BBCAD|nr:hypothetical protein [Micromonospora sp. WMMA1947]WBC10017.1 hypothetical protein O7604_03805 [Micromonospora sp. WMMA1947]
MQAPGPIGPGSIGPGPLVSGAAAPAGPESRPNPAGGRVPLVGPAPIGLHLSAPSPIRPGTTTHGPAGPAGAAHGPASPAPAVPGPASPAGITDDPAGINHDPAGITHDPAGAAHGPAEPDPPAQVEARPGRHSAPESLAARLADLTGGIGVRLRDAARTARTGLSRTPDPARPPVDAPVTRVAAARARRRRRRAVLAAVAVTGLVAALAYAVRSPASPPRETAPVAAPTEQAPGDQAPVVPVTGDPVSPGEPLLDVDLVPLPGTLSLTELGTRDWRHWGGNGADSFHRKASGSGEIQDRGGERLEHNAGACDLHWTDGTPTARQEGTRAGVFQRGAEKSFTLGVAGSGDLRTVRLFVGTFSAGARLDLSLSSGGDPVVREVALAAGDRFYQYVIRFRAAPGEQLLIRWRALTVIGGQNDGVALQAITVS